MEQSIFRASEIFDMAVGVEEQGIAFYQAAQTVIPSQIDDVLNYLIDQQRVHAETFLRMKEEVKDDFLLPESYPGERANYMNSFTRDQVFFDPLQALKQFKNVADELDAIRIAVDYERRSILFYAWIKQIVRKSEADVIDKIIAEEHLHISRLLKLRQEIEESRA
jgi:rubrerythrin